MVCLMRTPSGPERIFWSARDMNELEIVFPNASSWVLHDLVSTFRTTWPKDHSISARSSPALPERADRPAFVWYVFFRRPILQLRITAFLPALDSFVEPCV